MKKIIFFVIGALFLNTINAAGAAAAASHVSADSRMVYDESNPLVRAATVLAEQTMDLVQISPDLLAIDSYSLGSVKSFGADLSKGRRDTIVSACDGLPAEAAQRVLGFFDAAVRRVSEELFHPLDEASRNAIKAINVRTVEGAGPVGDFPHPFGRLHVLKGLENEVMQYMKNSLNAFADYQRRAFGGLALVRKIDQNQLILFLTGAATLVRGGEVFKRNTLLQSLYAAYVDPDFDKRKLAKLELEVAEYLPLDAEQLWLDTYLRPNSYVDGKFYFEGNRTKLEKPDILQILAEKIVEEYKVLAEAHRVAEETAAYHQQRADEDAAAAA